MLALQALTSNRRYHTVEPKILYSKLTDYAEADKQFYTQARPKNERESNQFIETTPM